MYTIQQIKSHYLFSDEDAETLKSLLPIAKENRDRMIRDFYDYLLGIPETAAFLQDEAQIQRLKLSHGGWFVNLFCGVYDNQYHHNLQRVGHVHVRIGLDAHFVNAAMQQVRRFAVGMIRENFPDRDERRKKTEAVEKILDINLDILTASYIEEELKKVFISKRFESLLVRATERFTYGLNLILVLALVGVSLSVVGLFFWEIFHVVGGAVEKGILGALGTLLILWMMIELMDNEIKSLKGGRFNIQVFIGVVIIAIIREILISTLRHDPLETQVFLAGTLLVLGVVYYLVARSQQLSISR
ncbi:protoglobin domain-containing protein [Geobacter sp.]|uniref:protoglobin domain-containing protein n=1 Tax=Geobacter sp. TaxID=46610 RepID=UPI00260E4E3C|nr:protoglobin domain-containing protein [Geobacter sp.]